MKTIPCADRFFFTWKLCPIVPADSIKVIYFARIQNGFLIHFLILSCMSSHFLDQTEEVEVPVDEEEEAALDAAEKDGSSEDKKEEEKKEDDESAVEEEKEEDKAPKTRKVKA